MSQVYTQANFQNVILTVLAIVVIVILIGCIYTFIRAIFHFIFSQSKEENKKKGRNSIRFMIIGVILTLILLFLIPTVLRFMNVPDYDVYTPKNIFSRAGVLINKVFQLGDIIKESQQNNEYRGNMYYDTTPDVQQPSSNGYQL